MEECETKLQDSEKGSGRTVLCEDTEVQENNLKNKQKCEEELEDKKESRGENGVVQEKVQEEYGNQARKWSWRYRDI